MSDDEKCPACDGKGGWITAEWTDPVSGPECEGERCGDCEGTGRLSAPLPAAPAPTAQPLMSIEWIERMAKAEADYDGAGAAPTEQAELPPLPEGKFYDTPAGPEIRFTAKQMSAFRAEGIIAALAHQLARIRHLEHERDTARADCAALAARQAPDTLRDGETDEQKRARQAAFRKTTICGRHLWNEKTRTCDKCGIAQEQAP